jgi:hypothetical protein
MTKEEKLAFEYGKTYTHENASKDAPCYDLRMHKLITEARTKEASDKNIKIMTFWREGRKASGA